MPETINGQPDMLRSYMVLLGMLMFLCFQQGALSPVTAAAVGNLPDAPARHLYGRRSVRHVDRQLRHFPDVPDDAGNGWSGGRLLYLRGDRHRRRDFRPQLYPGNAQPQPEQIEHYLRDWLSPDRETPPHPAPIGQKAGEHGG